MSIFHENLQKLHDKLKEETEIDHGADTARTYNERLEKQREIKIILREHYQALDQTHKHMVDLKNVLEEYQQVLHDVALLSMDRITTKHHKSRYDVMEKLDGGKIAKKVKEAVERLAADEHLLE